MASAAIRAAAGHWLARLVRKVIAQEKSGQRIPASGLEPSLFVPLGKGGRLSRKRNRQVAMLALERLLDRTAEALDRVRSLATLVRRESFVSYRKIPNAAHHWRGPMMLE